MRRLLIAVALLLAAASAARAQIAGGNITGTIHDEQGGALLEATVILTGSDRSAEATTDAAGKFRFLNLAPGVYKLKASHPGFSDFVQENVPVRVGVTSEVPLIMKLAGLQESITVGASAQTPIVDPRSTGTATNFTLADLEKIPTSRDPFSILRTVPGVLVDRVNIAGNETGQQANAHSKGTRQTDTVWTLDGIVITDMASQGVSPIYYNFDNFEEIHVTTAGQDIRQQTGGLGVNFVVRRGTNDFHGVARGYFTNGSLEGENIPDELAATGVTGATADHTQQISDVGFDFGGPLIRDELWFYGSYSEQDVRLIRTRLVDRTRIKNPYLKVNWQASRRDLVSFLYYDGDKLKTGRAPSGTASIAFPAATALQNQHNEYADNPFHGLWKVEDNHTFGSALFTSGKFAYFNTGFSLDPEGGLDMTSGRSARLSRSFGSAPFSFFVRPQWSVTLDSTAFHAWAGAAHDVKFGLGWRRADATSGTLWPGNGFLAIDNALTDRRVRLHREGRGMNRVETMHLYAGDTVQFSRLTVDAGVRFDHQAGAALPGVSRPNPVFPALVPGIEFPGVDLPFDWNTISPRIGATYALYDSRRVLLRGSFSRFASQMTTALTAFVNPTTTAGYREYRWNDANGDNLATPDEVLLDQLIAAGGGFSPLAPTAVTSPNRLADDITAPRTTSAVAGFDAQIDADLTLSVDYSYTRTANHVGQVATRIGMTRSDYAPGPPVTGTLQDGTTFNIPTFVPNMAKVIAAGNGFEMDNWPGYRTVYNGIEMSLVRRMKGRWMGRVSFALNSAREYYSEEGRYDTFGNPTRQDSEPLVDGGQFAPRSGPGAADVFPNAFWQFNASLLYILPANLEFALNSFGRQGYPLAPIQTVGLGADQINVLVSPEVDTFRLKNVWDTDLRLARGFAVKGAELRLIGDVFNVFNSNVELVRARTITAPNYLALVQNLSPRILRLGLTVGF